MKFTNENFLLLLEIGEKEKYLGEKEQLVKPIE